MNIAKTTLTLMMGLCLLNALAQKNQYDPLSEPFNVDKDTLYAMVDHSGKVINLPGMPYIRKWWPEKGRYREMLFNAETRSLVRTGWYKDKDCTEKDGLFEEFHLNGMAKDSGLYVNNKRQGTFASWYEQGQEHTIYHYKDDIPVDSCFTFFEDGALANVMLLDAEGNGLEQIYYADGNVKMLGKIVEGKRDGNWILKREDGTKMMEILYLSDSVAGTACYGPDGKTRAKGDCVFERVAEFPGGVKGWQAFLMKHLKYPNDAIDRNIQGVVRVQFIVAKDGSISEFKILSSPNKSLSDEVLRLMAKSPKWIPAVQVNKPVIYRHIQAITFRLQ
ncbi:MAG TPA: TonB family protein [Phnomibacter sp.]|nr:TonB family protein [Phnomibacter sp.]